MIWLAVVLSPDVFTFQNGNTTVTLNTSGIVSALIVVCVGWLGWVIRNKVKPPPGDKQ